MPSLHSLLARASRARRWASSHKVLACMIAIAVLGGGYWSYRKATADTGETRYFLGTVSSSTIAASISGSGQVSPSQQVEIKPKVSGEIVSVIAKKGAVVATGAAIAYIDSTSAQKAVRDAEANLESANIALAKLKQPATQLTLTQAQNALQNAEDALTTLYADSQTDIVNAFLDLPNIIASLQGITTGTNTNQNLQWNIDLYENAAMGYDNRASVYRDTAYNDYVSAKKAYDASFAAYQASRDSSDPVAIEKLLSDTYATVQAAAKAAKSINAFIQFYEDTLTAHKITPSPIADAALIDLNEHTGILNGHLSGLLSDTSSLRTDKQTITEKRQSLAEVQAGADALDLQSSQLNVTKAQNALTDAKNALADYVIRAPFAGTIADISLNKGDQAGPSTAAATIITKDRLANLSVNEVDAAKVAVGQSATLTFDAIDDLSIAGTIVSVDTLGTVSQGVVSYNIEINFSTQDARVKPGMTANAVIVTDTRHDVLVVPTSAVRTQNDMSFVQVFDPSIDAARSAQGVTSEIEPQQVRVEIGISDDTNVEIISGLAEGQQIVTRTTGAATTPPAGAASERSGLGSRPGGATFIAR